MRRRKTLAIATSSAAAAAVLALVLVGTVIRSPQAPVHPELIVDDVTTLNPTLVAEIIVPTTVEEIIDAVTRHAGPISIGGARHSMGGQIAAAGSLHIDMRRLNRVLAYSPGEKRITVQAGSTWRQIQERIDPDNLSISIMQTYADFTVGGSLSVNVHGRYVGLGPIILSVDSFRIVLPDGSLVEASPTVRQELFYGAIGGYGGLGVITDATLRLTDNVRVRRTDVLLPIDEYRGHFFDHVRTPRDAVFHNADIYPNAYDTVHSVTYSRTDDPATVHDRLIPRERSYGLNRLAYWMVSEWPFGKQLRQHLVDPLIFTGEPVSWRNYEASYDASELEPASRERSTYVLQEYFVPVDRFNDFIPKMRDVLRRHDAYVINISIRHAMPDPGSLLAWARSEVFAFVIYYKQETTPAARDQVGVWTRELIDAVLSTGGSYYLPYQIHATSDQFLAAYPRAPEFFALKRRLDPDNKFRNSLWDRYYTPVPQ